MRPPSGRVPEGGRVVSRRLYIQIASAVCRYNSWTEQEPCPLQRFGQVFKLDVTALHLLANIQGSHAGIVYELIASPFSALLAVKVNALF